MKFLQLAARLGDRLAGGGVHLSLGLEEHGLETAGAVEFDGREGFLQSLAGVFDGELDLLAGGLLRLLGDCGGGGGGVGCLAGGFEAGQGRGDGGDVGFEGFDELVGAVLGAGEKGHALVELRGHGGGFVHAAVDPFVEEGDL